MRQKSFIISIFVTLFILGMVAGVARAAYILQEPPTDEAAQLKQAMMTRDAQYQQSINEANARLEQANQAIQQLQQELQAQQASVAAASAQPVVPVSAAAAVPAPQAAVTSQEAMQAAITAASNWAGLANSQPELVDYQGKTAYEVKLDNGGSIYIDATDGSLLYNSLTGSNKAAISEDQAAKAAQAYLKGGGVFKVQRTLFNGQQAYRVIFDVGHRIYVSLGGDILDVELYSIVVSSGGGGGGYNGGSHPAPAAPAHHDDGGGGDD